MEAGHILYLLNRCTWSCPKWIIPYLMLKCLLKIAAQNFQCDSDWCGWFSGHGPKIDQPRTYCKPMRSLTKGVQAWLVVVCYASATWISNLDGFISAIRWVACNGLPRYPSTPAYRYCSATSPTTLTVKTRISAHAALTKACFYYRICRLASYLFITDICKFIRGMPSSRTIGRLWFNWSVVSWVNWSISAGREVICWPCIV